MILVFGSINIDLVIPVETLPRPGETVLGPGYRLVPGGKGANQALAARRAGGDVRMIGRVGRDSFADLALADLTAAGVDLRDVERDDQPTGCALVCVDRQGDNLIVVASGANRAVAAPQVGDALLEAKTLLLLQMEIPAAENWSLVRRARACGARILLNAAPAGPIPKDALAALDWLVMNEGEAVTVAKGLGLSAQDPRTAARALAAAGGIATVVTLGKAGTIAFHGEEAWRVGALPVDCVDSTGAGDAFVGAFAAAVESGADLPAALHRASVAGGLACLAQGAQPSLPDDAEITRYLPELAPPAAFTPE
ncbi:ribokinase [Rhodospirillaceae bacterium SYSU D60014]|uniref:ribokinase n=1 Tax=Virgifigura deserti TaxID=2268457 RepID=UPI000E670D5C